MGKEFSCSASFLNIFSDQEEKNWKEWWNEIDYSNVPRFFWILLVITDYNDRSATETKINKSIPKQSITSFEKE